MDFAPNKTLVEVINESAFGGTFRDIYSFVDERWYNKSWKKLDQLKDIDQKYYFSNYLMLVLINMVLNVEHH